MLETWTLRRDRLVLEVDFFDNTSEEAWRSQEPLSRLASTFDTEYLRIKSCNGYEVYFSN